MLIYMLPLRRSHLMASCAGYPQEPWLMTPVINAAEGSPEERYNTAHISTLNVMERCNSVLKNRFRCIMGERTLRYEPELVFVEILAVTLCLQKTRSSVSILMALMVYARSLQLVLVFVILCYELG
ncbi:hypothetical protein NQ318_005971 [Aromia moschata]|uniref:DDE Tnp4 domain-containing protein n=1 Tax=Aromia moschata TaxID=1265417 RepID=A0AAV8XF76_9CUCU|nr:hypothetical protein NQ318_005971 [Aromia moschata]